MQNTLRALGNRWSVLPREERRKQVSLVCITNDMPGVRSCTVKGQHADVCNGWRGSRECRGCLPKPAQHGLLCWNCWEQLVDTLTEWPRFAGIISGIDRAVQRDTAGVRTTADGHIPIPATRLSVDECESFLTSYKGSADDWVSRVNGAKDAINFTHMAQTAFRMHPIEEKPHRVTRFRCAKCGHVSLVWVPPQSAGDHVEVTCSTAGCDYALDQSSFEIVAELEEKKTA